MEQNDFTYFGISVKNDRFLNQFTMSDNNVNVLNSDEQSQCSTSSFAVPGVSEFAPPPSNNQSPPLWARGATKEDFTYMQRKYH